MRSSPAKRYCFASNAGFFTVAYGVTAAVGADGVPAPATVVAATVNVYAEPLVRFFSVVLVVVAGSGTGVCATPSLRGVTVYPVTGPMPVSFGAVQARTARASPATAVTAVGAAATAATTRVTNWSSWPVAFSARTVNVFVSDGRGGAGEDTGGGVEAQPGGQGPAQHRPQRGGGPGRGERE